MFIRNMACFAGAYIKWTPLWRFLIVHVFNPNLLLNLKAGALPTPAYLSCQPG